MIADEAILAVLIAAMEANRHVSSREAARAHHIIWSMRRFRRRTGDAVNRLVEDARRRLERDGVDVVLELAARAVPARLRPAVFAVAADLVLADTGLEATERRFLGRLAAALGVDTPLADDVVRVLRIKNGA